jgi:tetratricopeptide (TPR) repeat protein
MGFFGEWLAAGLYGRAVARFYQRRYEDAARLLEKVCKLDPDSERKELYYSYLGRSYFALGEHSKALEILSRAYEPYRKRCHSLEDEFQQREFLETLNALSEALRKVGQLGRADEVKREAEEYSMRVKKSGGSE